MYRYFYRFRRLPCYLCFFIFYFCGVGAGCVFLVVFWCRYCGWFRPVPRLVLRSVLRPALPFVSSFVPFFGPFFHVVFRSAFVSFLCSFFCLGVSGGRFVGRAVLFCSSGSGGVCSFSCFGVVAAMWGVCIVDGGGSADGVACRVARCIAFRAAGRVTCRSERRGAGRGGVCGIWK